MTTTILETRPAAALDMHVPSAAATDLAQWFALHRLATGRPALVCRWRRDADGRLACFWEQAIDIAPNQQRIAAAA
jgi:hypothetical protein